MPVGRASASEVATTRLVAGLMVAVVRPFG
jgi:hypothetical protein